MAQLQPYLTFSSTIEALNYYKEVFGAQKIKRVPVGPQQAEQFGVPVEKAAEMTMHSQFEILGNQINAADDFMQTGTHYQGISIMLDVNSEDADDVAAADAFWEKIASSNQVTINEPYKEQFWGGKMGDFTDKFGINWMLHSQPYSQRENINGAEDI